MPTIFRYKIKGIHPKLYWKEIFSAATLLLAVLFFRSERKELQNIIPRLQQADLLWIVTGLIITVAYILLLAGMYRKCFSAIGITLKWPNAVVLYLKRNLLSIFLPAGGVSSLAYTPSQLRKSGISQTQVHQASALFGFIGLLTVFLVGVPVIIYAISRKGHFYNAWTSLSLILLLLSLVVAIGRSLSRKGRMYHWMENKFPNVIPVIDELFSASVNKKEFCKAVALSVSVELCGILHVYIATRALGLPSSFGASATAYMISILMMVMSPFLRGLGAVELVMVYVLGKFGFSSVQALAITVLYRVFEFWLPMAAGIFSFAWKGRHIFLRLFPAILIFIQGIINIISVVTPPLTSRLHLIREYLPLSAIHASNFMVLFIGLMLLITSASLIRGMRYAWVVALILSTFSLIGNLLKALDYEEALLSAITIILLLLTANQYRTKSSTQRMRTALITATLVFGAVIVFGFTSFNFIDSKHFGIDFTWQQSLWHTIRGFMLVEDESLHPVTGFGQEFVMLIRILGFIAWGFLLFAFIKPKLFRSESPETSREKANYLLSLYGSSASDYFKLHKDKLLFFSELHEAFIAYRIAGGFAIVLEDPVCKPENKLDVIKEFEWHCKKMGLKTAFYRVDESSITYFNELRKRKLVIGQEAILELDLFSLEGKDNKSLRNAINSLQKKSYTTIIHKPPYTDEFLAELKKVSDEWLNYSHRNEVIFSQGMFDENELQQQNIIAIHDISGQIKAFLNIIPDFTPDECTYDLIRKTADAPGGCIDALIIKLVEYARAKGFHFINMGMVPMNRQPVSENAAEQLINIAVEKIRFFRHYRGLRDFKAKYATIWENKYLVYENDFDLLLLPTAINKVMQP